MPVDLAFELSYLLSDKVGAGVEVKGVNFNPDTGELCVEAVVEGRGERRACTVVKPCRGLREEAKWLRCVSRTLTASEKHVEELARGLA